MQGSPQGVSRQQSFDPHSDPGRDAQPCAKNPGIMSLEPQALSRGETDLYLDHKSVRMGGTKRG